MILPRCVHGPAPLARRAMLAAMIAALAACSGGYPTEGLGDDLDAATVRAGDIVERLNRMNGESLTRSRWRFTLVEPCELKLRARRPDGSAATLRLGLRHSDVQVKGNVGGSSHGVLVAYAGAPELAEERVFEAPRWTDAVEYATQFQALQRSCTADAADPATND